MVRVDGDLAHQLGHIFEQTWKKVEGKEQEITAQPSDRHNDKPYTIHANAPDSGENHFTEVLLNQLEEANSLIRLSTPYFTPGKHLTPALQKALQRGVKLEIILSKESKYAAFITGKHCCGELLEKGASIFYYQPAMLHVKMMVIDNKFASLGSSNLDGMSLHQNQEAMIVSFDEQFAHRLNQHFETDKSHSEQYSYEDWLSRPAHEKCLAYGLSPFRHYL